MKTSSVRNGRLHQAFTLVELLVVISIIGILMGLAVTAVNIGLKKAHEAAIKTELATIASGVESYKLKYGVYPPDMSSWNVVERHYRRIFPQIASTELLLLHRLGDTTIDANAAGTNDALQQATSIDPATWNPVALDRAEAIVWSLGGFSSDPQFPFTGSGGPLSLLPSTNVSLPANVGYESRPMFWQYNVTRENGAMDFSNSNLSLTSPDSSSAIGYTNRVQSDEDDTVGGLFLDLFPVIRVDEESSPYVYFDSRTYTYTPAGTQLNGYAFTIDTNEWDVVRPLLSDELNANKPYPSATSATYGTFVNSLDAYMFVNRNTFQVLSPGLDGRYGRVADFDGDDPTNEKPVYFQYPSGQMIYADASADDPTDLKFGSIKRYDLGSRFPLLVDAYEKDNLANFSEGTFGSKAQ